MASREQQRILAQIKLMDEHDKHRAAKQKFHEEREFKKKQERPAWISSMQSELEDVPEFHPTEEEFEEPMAYIRQIYQEACKYGTIKIVPPGSWRPKSVVSEAVVPTNLQTVQHRVVDFEGGGVAFQTAFKKHYRTYTLDKYRKVGERRAKEILGEAADKNDEMTTEREFWNHVTTATNFKVQYANDVEGTACEDRFQDWDLAKLPKDRRSVLQLVRDEVPGVNTPMLYVGVLFAHFCWHYEDNALYSINYMHYGAPKTWYVVPGEYAGALDQAAREIFRNHPDRKHPLMKDGENMLMRKTMMISPSLLKAKGVPVFRCTQRPGQFIVTFPRSYHCGFNHGFHVGEAVNFAVSNWLPYGFFSLQRYRNSSSMSCIDVEKLLMEMACKVVGCRVEDIMFEGLKPRQCERHCKLKVQCDLETRSIVATTFRQLATWQLQLMEWAEDERIPIAGMEVQSDDPYDRQLCCACNHILHLSYVERSGNTNPELRACPEHAEFLGPGQLQMRVKYSKKGLSDIVWKLTGIPNIDLHEHVPGERKKKCKVAASDSDHKASYRTPPPRSPMFQREKDKFPTLAALLCKDAGKRIREFRYHLTSIKPSLELSVPELFAVTMDDLRKDEGRDAQSVVTPVNKRCFSHRTQSTKGLRNFSQRTQQPDSTGSDQCEADSQEEERQDTATRKRKYSDDKVDCSSMPHLVHEAETPDPDYSGVDDSHGAEMPSNKLQTKPEECRDQKSTLAASPMPANNDPEDDTPLGFASETFESKSRNSALDDSDDDTPLQALVRTKKAKKPDHIDDSSGDATPLRLAVQSAQSSHPKPTQDDSDDDTPLQSLITKPAVTPFKVPTEPGLLMADSSKVDSTHLPHWPSARQSAANNEPDQGSDTLLVAKKRKGDSCYDSLPAVPKRTKKNDLKASTVPRVHILPSVPKKSQVPRIEDQVAERSAAPQTAYDHGLPSPRAGKLGSSEECISSPKPEEITIARSSERGKSEEHLPSGPSSPCPSVIRGCLDASKVISTDADQHATHLDQRAVHMAAADLRKRVSSESDIEEGEEGECGEGSELGDVAGPPSPVSDCCSTKSSTLTSLPQGLRLKGVAEQVCEDQQPKFTQESESVKRIHSSCPNILDRDFSRGRGPRKGHRAPQMAVSPEVSPPIGAPFLAQRVAVPQGPFIPPSQGVFNAGRPRGVPEAFQPGLTCTWPQTPFHCGQALAAAFQQGQGALAMQRMQQVMGDQLFGGSGVAGFDARCERNIGAVQNQIRRSLERSRSAEAAHGVIRDHGAAEAKPSSAPAIPVWRDEQSESELEEGEVDD